MCCVCVVTLYNLDIGRSGVTQSVFHGVWESCGSVVHIVLTAASSNIGRSTIIHNTLGFHATLQYHTNWEE